MTLVGGRSGHLGADSLNPEVAGITRQLFARLSAEDNHGKMLAMSSLAYLRAAKNGLSEAEVIDVFSNDEGILDDFRKSSFI